MDVEFAGLESKVEQVASLCDALRAENHRLRTHIDDLEAQQASLTARMTEARTRLEAFMDNLPAE